jgi:hypothetical protein
MALVIGAQAVLWLSGARDVALSRAVEAGAAYAESRGIGEVGDDVIRKAIQTQHATRLFWSMLVFLGDFVGEPLWLLLRAILVATVFSGAAALTGRPTRFADGLSACIAAQGFWVLGLIVRASLVVALRRPDVETSLTLLLPAGHYDASTWVTLEQLDLFAALGWLTMIVGGWRRGQVNLFTALLVCGILASMDALIRMSSDLILNAGMRLMLAPETPR